MCSRMCGTEWRHGVLIRTFLYDCHDPKCQWSKSYPGGPPPHTIIRHVAQEADEDNNMPKLIIPQNMIDAARRAREEEARQAREASVRLARTDPESARRAPGGHTGSTQHGSGSGSGHASGGQSSGRHGSGGGHGSSAQGNSGQGSAGHGSGGQSSSSQSTSNRSGSSKASKLFGKRFSKK